MCLPFVPSRSWELQPCRLAPLLYGVIFLASSCGQAQQIPTAGHITAKTRNETAATATVPLAAGGKALLPIVISPGASESTKAVAADLAKYLGKLSGATFEVRAGDGSKGLVLGTLAEFPNAALKDALELYEPADGVEAFAIRTTPGKVALTGNTDLGVSNAAYRLLEELGCRWLSPSPDWEIIPSVPDLKWNKDITDRPQVLSRVLAVHTAFGNADWKKYNPNGDSPTNEFKNWKRRNVLNESFTVNAGHNWNTIIDTNKAEFAAHPEYYPLINGKRVIGDSRYGQPDIGNPAVRKMFVDYALNYFRKKPEADMVSIEPNDGGLFSQSPEFKALGSISDAVFGLANEVARALQQEFPGKMVGMYSYREHSEPPSFALEPNVHVQFTGLIIGSQYTRDEILGQWAKKHHNMGFYDYYAPYEWYFDQLPGANASSLDYLQSRISAEAAANATSVVGQSSNSWFLLGMGHWAAAKMLWNPALKAQDLKTEYLQVAFGPAAGTMRHFYDLWDTDKSPIISNNMIYEMYQDIIKAGGQAKDRPDVLARLDDIKDYLRFQELDFRLRDIPKEAPYETKRQAFIDLFSHIHRVRFEYVLNYYLAIQNLWQKRAELVGIVKVTPGKPKELVDKTLLPRDPNCPWIQIDRPYTAAEREANFQAGLEFFKSPPVQDIAFSSDLVPIEWNSRTAKQSLLTTFQGGTARFAIYSDGSPVKFALKAGSAGASYNDRPWWLKSPDGSLVRSGAISPRATEDERQISVAVPNKGLYFLEAKDESSGYLTVELPPEENACVILRRGVSLNESGPAVRPLRYLYVPKGTREITYFYNAWYPEHKVLRPDESVAFEGISGRSFNSLPVPTGMDGKVWAFQVKPGTFWPANLPPVMAVTPGNLMVPRDLALKDGLPLAAH